MKIKTFDNLTTLTKVTLYGKILAIFHRPLKKQKTSSSIKKQNTLANPKWK